MSRVGLEHMGRALNAKCAGRLTGRIFLEGLQELPHDVCARHQSPQLPPVIAKITNFVGFANAIPAALPLLDASIASDTAVYPTPDEQQHLFVQLEDPPEQSRAITRIWQRFKTGQ